MKETLAILCGGESKRMGQDKALMPFLGQPLIQRILERLRSVAEQVILSANRSSEYSFLGLPVYTDLIPGCAALGGLYTVLSTAQHPAIAVVACDMPFANRELFKYERLLLSQSGADVVIPQAAEGLEPMHAVYRRETCLPVVRSALEAGHLKMVDWLPKVNVKIVRLEEVARFDPHGLAFWNVNTSEEFQRAEEWARAEKGT